MNCTCITEQENRVLGGFKEGKLHAPNGKKVKNVSLQGVCLNFTEGCTVFTVTFNADLEGQKKPYAVSMIASYCPFCGKSTNKQSKEEVAP